jgi:phospholipase/lecithinase/hemolysin
MRPGTSDEKWKREKEYCEEKYSLPMYFPGDVWHPNIEGHRLIAQSLAASIPLK